MKMIHRRLSTLLANKLIDYKLINVRNSALFINGAKATDNFVYITPHVDFPERIKQKDVIQQQLLKRKSNVDLGKIESLWNIYEELRQRKLEYDKKKEEISRELGKLIKTEPDSDASKKLKIQIGLIKDNIKKLKVPLWSAEEAAIVEALKLPNELHPQTPDSENRVVYTHMAPPNNNKNHLKIGEDLNIIDFKKNENYYLKGDAAIFELGAKMYFNSLLRSKNFVHFSNPDFVKSVIIEGCGGDYTNSDCTFILHQNEDTANTHSKLHLTGGGSLTSFFAYHAKNVLYPKVLPIKYFSMGRQYAPSPSELDNLYHVSQSSVVQVFGAAKTVEDVNILLQELTDILKASYEQLGYHFRLCIITADRLHMWESLRVVVELYSTSMKNYIEVANVSVSGDFISKRLMLTYVEDKRSKFPHIISGTVLNVPRLLACVLEQDGDFSMPEQFKVENWSMVP